MVHEQVLGYDINGLEARYHRNDLVLGHFLAVDEVLPVGILHTVEAVAVRTGGGLKRKELFLTQKLEDAVKGCLEALGDILKCLDAGLAVHLDDVVIILCKELLVRLHDIAGRGLVVYPDLIVVVYSVEPMILIVGQEVFIVFLRKPVLLDPE